MGSKAKHSSSRSAPISTKNDMDKSIKGHTKPHVSMKDKPENQSQLENITPKNSGVDMPCKRLFHETLFEKEEDEIDIVPTETDLEILLINSCRIDAIKVQTIVESFVREKEHTTIFCMTETKVHSHDFQPRGISMFSAHRTKKEKKGGGLAIRFDETAEIKLKEINTKSNDILALEGTVLKSKFRI